MTATGAQFRDFAVAKRGYRYMVGPTRTTGADGYFDCSGLVYYAATKCGLHIPSISWTIALFCEQNGGAISMAKALHTPGALLFKGPNSGHASSGIHGHVAICIGDGVNVIEAKGHAWGVLVDNQANNSSSDPWTFAAFLPGISYGVVVPPAPPPPPPPVVVPPPVTLNQGDGHLITDIATPRLDQHGNGEIPLTGIPWEKVEAVTVLIHGDEDPLTAGKYAPSPSAVLVRAGTAARVVLRGGAPYGTYVVRVLHPSSPTGQS